MKATGTADTPNVGMMMDDFTENVEHEAIETIYVASPMDDHMVALRWVATRIIDDCRRIAIALSNEDQEAFAERAGVPRSVAMKLTGHKTEAVYRRYAIADHKAITEGVEKLARLHTEARAGATVLPIGKTSEG